MVELAAKTPLDGFELPMEIGEIVIDQVIAEQVSSIMPFEGQVGPVSEVLVKELRIELSGVGQVKSTEACEIFWTGQNQWFLSGIAAPKALNKIAGVTDQTDGWAILSLHGEASQDVMARLCPLDLRDFRSGQVARTEFAHMMSIILPQDGGYDIWVMRSMAKTALEHLTEAATLFSATKALRS